MQQCQLMHLPVVFLVYRTLHRWDEPTEAELDDGATHRAAPPDEEQYALSSQLVTMVGQAAQGLTALLKGGYVAKSKPVANLLHQKQTRSSDAGASSPTGLAAESSAMITGDALQQSLGLLQRSTLLMHELAGLKPQPGAQPISKHNIDALFVHGTIQVWCICLTGDTHTTTHALQDKPANDKHTMATDAWCKCQGESTQHATHIP